jgi:hypothetical protein
MDIPSLSTSMLIEILNPHIWEYQERLEVNVTVLNRCLKRWEQYSMLHGSEGVYAW